MSALDFAARLPDAEPANASTNGTAPGDQATDACVTVRDYLAAPRVPIEPYVATPDGSSVLLARGSLLLIAGPSGVGKSLAGAWDLGGRLASAKPSSWLGLRVCGGLRVLLLSFEGSDEDTADRAAIVPDDAADRFLLWDRWTREDRPAVPLPRAGDDESLVRLARRLREQRIDVVAIDTGSKFFAGHYDTSKGIPEEAIEVIDRLRELVGRPLTFVVVVHTRKLDRSTRGRDELEEVAGTFGKNADAVLVIRRDGEDRGPRRRIAFAKTRRGPELADVIAAFPGRGEPGPPRLTVVADLGGAAVKEGTGADEMASWIREQPEPVSTSALMVRFDLSESTMRRRAGQLEEVGIKRGKIPRRGNAHGYGTNDQWAALFGAMLAVEGTAS